MSDIEKPPYSPSGGSAPLESGIKSTENENNEDDFEKRLAGLPEKYRDEILRQYEIPEDKVTLFAVLRHATMFEKLLMIIGTIMAIASGIIFPYTSNIILTFCRCRTPSYDCYLRQFDKCFRRIWLPQFVDRHQRSNCR